MVIVTAPTPLRRRSRFVPHDAMTRRLALATLVNTFGNGLFMTISALFFTRSVGLSVTQVGLGLTIGGCFGVVAGVPAGHAADRFGARRLFVVLILTEALGMIAYTQVHSMATFLPAVCVVAFVDRASSAVRNTVIAVALPADKRASTRAYLRVVTNAGIGAGSAIAAIALQADTRAAYLTLIVLDALTFVVTAVLLGRLPMIDKVQRVAAATEAAPSRAYTDRPYLAITVLNAILMLQFGIMNVGLPLWIAGHTRAPRLLVSVVFIMNTVMIVLLQVRGSRNVDTVQAAGRAARRSGFLLGGACLIYAAAGGTSVWVAVTVIVVGGIVQTFGEIISSAAGWTLSYDLAAPDAPGAYQGVFASGFAAGQMLAPVIVTATAIHLGKPGWAILAAVFVLTGVALVPVAKWALRTRPVIETVPSAA